MASNLEVSNERCLFCSTTFFYLRRISMISNGSSCIIQTHIRHNILIVYLSYVCYRNKCQMSKWMNKSVYWSMYDGKKTVCAYEFMTSFELSIVVFWKCSCQPIVGSLTDSVKTTAWESFLFCYYGKPCLDLFHIRLQNMDKKC